MSGKTRRGNHEGSIYKRTSGSQAGRWCAELTLASGATRYLSATTRAELVARFDAAKREDAAGRLLAGGQQTVRAWFNTWADEIKLAEGIRAGTHTSYRIRLGHIARHIGDKKLCEVTPDLITRVYTSLQEHMSRNNVAQIHVALKAAFRTAVEWGHIPSNPVALVKPPRVTRTEMHFLTRQHVQTLLAATEGEPYHALWALLATAGLRINEALALRWPDISIDTAPCEVRVSHTLRPVRGGGMADEPQTKTESGMRDVPLLPRVATILRHHREEQRRERLSAVVFPNAFGALSQYTMVRREFAGILARAGLPAIRVHDLRHTAATAFMLPASGYDYRLVAKWLGHKSPTTTLERYAHVELEREAATVITMDRFLTEVG